MPLSRETLNEIIDLLLPLLTNPAARTSLLDRALGLDARSTALRSRMDFEGPTSNFVVALVRHLHDYGESESGKTALWQVMEVAREEMGVDRQARVDALRPLLNQVESPNAPRLPNPATYAPPSSDHVFISYSRADKDVVLRLVSDLEPLGVRVWVDQSGLIPGTPDWEQALRDAIRGSRAVILAASPESRRSVYVKDELRIAQMYERPIYPIWVAGEQWMDSIPLGLGGVQFIDIRGSAYTPGSRTLADALRPVSTPTESFGDNTTVVERDPQEQNPYKGLQAFTAADTRYFFGRDALVTELIAALNENERFLAVVGASGSGKSSVVMAGLLPRLAQMHPEWTFLGRMVPGAHPLEALAQTLAKGIPGSLALTIQRELESDNALRGLHVLAGQINPVRVVLFVDQFEELFTLTTDEAERSRFITLLTTAATETKGALLVVLTMRADFMDRPLAYDDLVRLFQAQAVLVKPMGVIDLRDLILRPAALQGLTFEDDLVGDLLFEVRGEAGALPLLEFTLEQLYERREGQRLTRAAYREIGGVRGALAGQAERTYLALPSDGHRQLARALFLRLIEPGATEQDTTRRRANRADLTLTDAEQTRMLQDVAAQFVDSRLLVSSENTLEVAHEALIREWSRLKSWLDGARDDLRIQNKINDDAADWVRAGRPADYGGFYAGTLLVDAQRWQANNVAAANEADFIAASAGADAARRAEDLRIARRVQRLQRVQLFTGIAIAILMIVVAASFIVGVNLAGQAGVAQTKAADANATLLPIPITLAAAAGEVSTSNADATYAAGLFNETLRDVETQMAEFHTEREAAETSVAEANAQVANANATLLPVPGTLTAVAEDIAKGQAQLRDVESQRLAALGEILLAQPNGNDETAALLGIRALTTADTPVAWDLLRSSVDQLNYGLAVLVGHTENVNGALALSDGRLLSWSWDSTLRLWAADGTPGPVLQGHTNSVTGALELSDGRLLSWSSEDKPLRLWAADGTPGPVLTGHTSYVWGALELSDGRLLSWSYDGTLRLWAADGTPGPVLQGHTGSGVLELSDGRLLSWSRGTTLRLWAADGTPGRVLEGHTDTVTGALELSDGRLLSWSSEDKTLRLWGADGTSGPVLEGHTDTVTGALELSDGHLLSWSDDKTLRLWAADGTPGPVLEGHTDLVGGALELLDGRLLSWSSEDKTLRLWAADGTPGPVLVGHTDTVTGALELPDGRLLSWSSEDKTLRLWAADGTPGPVLTGHTDFVYGALELPDGRLLSWSRDRTLRLWAADGTPGPVLTGHADFVLGTLELSDERLLSWSWDNTLRLWAADGTPGPVLTGHTNWVNGALELSNGRLLSWSSDSTLRLWAADGTLDRVLEGHTSSVWGALELSNRRLLSWSQDSTLRLWAADGTPGRVLEGHTSSAWGALELSDGRLLSWSADGMLRLWAADGTPDRVLEGHTSSAWGALELSDGRLLSWSADSTLRLWAADGTPGRVLEGHTDDVNGALELSDGRLLSWSQDSTLRLWSADGTPGRVLEGHKAYVNGVLELSDGRLLSWSWDQVLRLWARDGTPSSVLEGHTEVVNGALELLDGRLLSWSADFTLRLWAAGGIPGRVLEEHINTVNGALVLSDGRLLSWSDDRTLRLWYLNAADEVTFACTRVFRDFTAEERTQFGLDESPTCPKFTADNEELE